MRPSASDSLYKDLDAQEGVYEYNLPAGYAIRPLKLSDVSQVDALEGKTFKENERASREKIEYRLKVCPELCAGVFVREFNWPESRPESVKENGNADTTTPGSTEAEDDDDDNMIFGVVSKRSTLKDERLVGHIISTKTTSSLVTDESMEIGGHDETGNTIAVHSVAVDPEFQGRHIGYVMMRDYVQKFFSLGTAEQMSLICKEEMVPFYAKHGFKDEGESKSHHGGETWRAMRLPFDTYDDQLED